MQWLVIVAPLPLLTRLVTAVKRSYDVVQTILSSKAATHIPGGREVRNNLISSLTRL